jgi:hypothetical protein
MTPEMTKVLFAAFAVWGALVAWKAVKALRTNEEYRFGMWDGGMLREGKHLNRVGTFVKLATAILIMAWCAIGLAGIMVTGDTFIVFIGILIASVVSDLINSR